MDEQNSEQLSIYVRFPGEGEQTEDHFAGLVKVSKANAETLINAIQKFLTQHQVDPMLHDKCLLVLMMGML